jgi:hypothetical protein
MIYQVFVKRKGNNSFSLVQGFKTLVNAQELENYYKEQSWVSETKIDTKVMK